jgi:predicted RNA-binding Zn ribbon-like protein
MSETIPFREGAGRLSLDFLRTLRWRGTADAVEELPDGAALAAWVAQFGPPGLGDRPGVEPGAALAAEARRLREAVYELIGAARGPGGVASCGTGARRLVNASAAAPVPVPRLDPAGRLRWHADDPAPAILALLARDAIDLVSTDAVERVRGCADPTCGVWFVDNSRPGSRRWCSMGACGNRAKKHALRERSAAIGT